MANKLDPRNDVRGKELLKRLPRCQYTPLVGAADLEEIAKVFAGIPGLEFPIGSAGELIEKLGGAERRFQIAGVDVNHLRMIKYVPAYYFPIVSVENFIEKMAELVRANRKAVDVPKELHTLRHQLGHLKFPIGNHAELLAMLRESRQQFTFQGGPVDPEKIMGRIPPTIFPIESLKDLETKVAELMLNRPLIVKD